MKLRLYNTLIRKKEEFRSLKKNKVGLYCCGPTVYNRAHIGNLRAYIFEDVLRRVLEMNAYEVKHVMNITDVGHLASDADEGEDKMILGAKREGKTVWEIAKFYEEEFNKDIKSLNIKPPTISCRVTEHIKEIIETIKKIEKNGYTYESDGNIYFDISKFKHYYNLSGHKPNDEETEARVDEDSAKRNKSDFVLWFTKSKFGNQDMQWDSPWGRGFPGWHVECSAMSIKYLGEQFDIHCGGIDHVNIHHTNEIAQSEASTGKHSWVKYWLHNEFLVMDKGKMAKSAGEFLTLTNLEKKGYNPLVYRYFCLGAHYRQQLKFSWEGLDGALNTYNRCKEKIIELKEKNEQFKETEYQEEKTEEYMASFTNAINDDLNTPQALAVMWSVLRDEEIDTREKLALLYRFDDFLGLGFRSYFRDKVDVPKEVKKIMAQREDARMHKDWQKADKLRDRISEAGFMVIDTDDGPKIEKGE
ncbi:cysteine--tRNA ligase [Candidatus Woesearchaeota archaeon]|nr:cysteine--tRNA ligase [Candidatus Woesearchaeota archaeon]